EPESIAIAQAIQAVPILTPSSPDPVQTPYVHQAGEKPPILLLHGFDSSLFEYRRLLPKLAPQHEVWAIDLFGFGFTERRPELTYNPEAIKAHIQAFWQTQIQQPVILVGASMGGAAAIDFTLSHPEAVRQLILIDSAGIPQRPWTWRLMFPPLDKWATEFLRSPKVREQISRKAYADEKWVTADANCCAALHLDVPDWSLSLMNFTKSGGYGSFAKQLPDLKQPTLLLWGERDAILGTKDANVFTQLLPNAKLVWIPEAGHVPHLEQSARVATEILQFVAQDAVALA
ncbi:MAG: alpha/beta hydrolase, partial [Spirulina sp. SIO3F2]|nr:alpha/beta hydrolase [Spirulina sp. SIO3F2]